MDHASWSDQAFVRAFLDCTLPPMLFDHLGHVRVAWLLLRERPRDEAIDTICGGIERYATHLGARNKFHRTMSEALVRIMSDTACQFDSWRAFVSANPRLMSDVPGLLDAHYSPELIACTRAREIFLAPDRLPL